MSYHIIHDIIYHAMSCHISYIVSYRIYHIVSCHITYIISYIMACHVISYILWYKILKLAVKPRGI